ncbi:MAG: hypothetical protein FWC72_04640, partial [Oscillospiraceae bacterium]|nr:hypothetical protein [Oscillospiraceae bacterium]
MKKRFKWILAAILCLSLAMVFVVGLWAGAILETERQESQRVMQAGLQTTIAVVNADVGVLVDGVQQNFASAIIDTLSDDFVLVSPAMAHTGLADGVYGAIVTFPSNVSAQVLSFNANQPERVRLDFQINPYLTERDYVETFVRIIDLQQSINTMLSYTFMSSVFGQFHMAQDHVDQVFANDLATIEALDILYFPNFTPLLQLDALPDVPFEPNEIDTSDYLRAFTDFARNISRMYRDSYAAATRDYLTMREGLIQLTDDFPLQKEEWLTRLYAWTDYSVQYGIQLEQFAEYHAAHMRGLDIWHEASVTWIETVEDYEDAVHDWSEYVQNWFEHYAGWVDEHQAYWELVGDFARALHEHRDALGINQVEAALLEWQGDLTTFVTNFLAALARFNVQFYIADEYFTALDNWRIGLQGYHNTVAGWNAPLQASIADVRNYFPSYIPYGMEDFVASVGVLLSNPALAASPPMPQMPPRPDLIDTTDWGPLNWDSNVDLWPPGLPFEFLFPSGPSQLPGTLPPRPIMSSPPAYPTVRSPGAVPEPEPATMVLPMHPQLIFGYDENPLVSPPPQPYRFWASLELKHEKLLSFDVGEYLTEAIIDQVDGMLASYEAYLYMVRADMEGQFSANVMLLHEVYFAYGMFLATLRMDALQAEADGVSHLHRRLGEFFDISTDFSADTQGRLFEFAGMMPESRAPGGLNRDLVGFAVSPFDAVPPAVRAEMEAVEASLRFFRLATWILGGLILVTALAYLGGHFRAKR